jgi:hypothetical protein
MWIWASGETEDGSFNGTLWIVTRPEVIVTFVETRRLRRSSDKGWPYFEETWHQSSVVF